MESIDADDIVHKPYNCKRILTPYRFSPSAPCGGRPKRKLPPTSKSKWERSRRDRFGFRQTPWLRCDGDDGDDDDFDRGRNSKKEEELYRILRKRMYFEKTVLFCVFDLNEVFKLSCVVLLDSRRC